MIKTVGKFQVTVMDGYPIWIVLEHKDGGRIQFSHRELGDLRYALISATAAAKDELKRVGRDDEVT